MGTQIETLIRNSVAKGAGLIAAFNRRRLPQDVRNPYLTGIHEPMDRELDLTELAVDGTIPAGLDGRYLRIGPNPVDPDPASYHWFVGDGMVHGIRIADGRALWYRNRWIRSEAVAASLGVQPAPGPRHLFDTVNTNVVGIAGRTFALVEAGSYPVELGDTLEQQRFNPFEGTLRGSFSAHPHLDPLTGELHAICYEGPDPSRIRHVVVGPEGLVTRELAIPVRDGPMIHDCALTARFVIILDLPVTFSMRTLLAGHGFPYRWNPEHPARIGLLPRTGEAGDIIWCEMEPAFAFHVANAYDRPDGLVELDVCAYPTMFAGSTQGPDNLPRGLERWTIDPATRRVEVRTIDAAPQDFPRIDERLFGQPHRFIYSMALPEHAGSAMTGATKLYRHDLSTGVRQVHDFGPGRHPGEFVFVPKSPASREQEGWLMGLVVDLPKRRTELAILDCEDFEGSPAAVVHLPHRVPPGFHGNWIPAGRTRQETGPTGAAA
jgi:carotenoid cleavage dioxygenase-like enzyme